MNASSLIDVQVPDIGDFSEVTVIELLVKPGDTVNAEQSIITVESDKASMEIPSSHAGVVKELRVKLGDKVKQGSVVLVLEGAAAAPSAASAVQAPAPVAAAPLASDFGGAADIECDLLVLGGGPGGYSAAFRAADLGLKVVIVERYADFGRRVPERGLHPVEGAAACGRGHGRGQPHGRSGRETLARPG
jgi:dihydrolipoamide dehydrogenase